MADPIRQSVDAKTKRGTSDASRANLTGGSRKGIPNRTTKAAKDAIAEAAEKLGGVNRLAAWAQESPDNEKAFWSTIYTKLIAVQVTGEGGRPIVMAGELRLVGVKAS